MGTLIASTLIAQASEVAQDESNVVWTAAQALRWLNDAQRSVAIVRPDASVNTHSIQLTAGTTKQTISGRRLMSVVRNMGSDGNTPGRAIRLVERAAKDEFEPNWHQATPSIEIIEYIFDSRTPKEFYVSPPAHASTDVYIEVCEAVNPAEVDDEANAITLDDIYSPVMVEWIVYRFFSRDSEETPNIQRAASHFQQFFAMLGAKMNPDMAVNPKVRAHLS